MLPDEPRSAPVHRAPAETWRPLSVTAVILFLVGLAAAVVAVGGLLVVAVAVLVVDAIALGTVRWTERRGRPLVLASMAIVLVAGLAGYVNAKATRDRLSDRAAHLLAALRGGDASAVDRWIDEAARKSGAADRIRRRYEEAVRAVGPYRGPVEAGGLWFGATAAFAPPEHGAETTAPGETPAAGPPESTAWVLATFERGTLHVALVPRGAGDASVKGRMDAMLNAIGPTAGDGVWVDVRFFSTR